MKKVFLVILAIIILAIAYWLASPLFLNKEIRESIEEIQKPGSATEDPKQTDFNLVAQGVFVGVDDFHKAEGTAKVIKADAKYFIRFEDDFKVTNGPDLFIYFGKNGSYIKETQIAALKGNVGSQNYEIPTNINPLDYNEVWIWCRAFSVPFGYEILK